MLLRGFARYNLFGDKPRGCGVEKGGCIKSEMRVQHVHTQKYCFRHISHSLKTTRIACSAEADKQQILTQQKDLKQT